MPVPQLYQHQGQKGLSGQSPRASSCTASVEPSIHKCFLQMLIIFRYMNVCCEVFAVFENILGSNLWLQISDDDNVLIDFILDVSQRLLHVFRLSAVKLDAI